MGKVIPELFPRETQLGEVFRLCRLAHRTAGHERQASGYDVRSLGGQCDNLVEE